MNIHLFIRRAFLQRIGIFGICILPSLAAVGQNSIELKFQNAGTQLVLRWPTEWISPTGKTNRPLYELQSSEDLRLWQPVESTYTEASGTETKTVINLLGTKAFYRLVGKIINVLPTGLANGGEEVFGYADAFNREIQKIGQISPQEFYALYAVTNSYLPTISWDPTTALYWTQFNQNTNFQLNAKELEIFKKNGFVVTKRLGSQNFADLFYRIYKGDLPVYISTDAILQAWYRSYDLMLEELEETYIYPKLNQIVNNCSDRIPAIASTYGQGVLKESILDADYFLAVARSLLSGLTYSGQLGQQQRVKAALDGINSGQVMSFNLFGESRVIDFSQFTVRGHYESSDILKRYFRAMIWLGRIDLRIAGRPFDDGSGPKMARPRELGAAIVLYLLLTQNVSFQNNQYDSWLKIDKVLNTFVGWTDSMTFSQLGDVLAAANIKSLSAITNLAVLENLQADLLKGQYGFQNIRSDYYVSPLGAQKMVLPRSFTFMGQKFVLDSWAFTKLVFDDILWIENGVTNKLMRRIPSALDAAFSVLGNNQIVPEIVARITNEIGRQFRDGYSYQHNLAAVKNVIDSQNAACWQSSIYSDWLGALRTLSPPTMDPRYPEAMRTRAWAMKTLNTQLASWTQLRHDTILYAKPSYTGMFVCVYPAGYVEPRVEFWQYLQDMALRTMNLINQLDYDGTVQYQNRSAYGMPTSKTADAWEIQAYQIDFLDQFSKTVSTLKNISSKELNQTSLTVNETSFLEKVVESESSFGSGNQKKYDGWYPKLFYRSVFHRDDYANAETFHQNAGSAKWDALVVDVHTDLPCPDVGDPGSVLHQGVGNVDLLMIAVDNGTDHMVYAGPVLSHYEFEIIGAPKRKTDTEWKSESGKWPSPPEWTSSYLLP